MSATAANALSKPAPTAPVVAAPVVRARPRPAPGLVWAFIAWAVLGLAVSVGLAPARIWSIVFAALPWLAAFDLWRLLRAPTPEVARALPEAWPIGVERDVELRIEHYGRRQRLTVP